MSGDLKTCARRAVARDRNAPSGTAANKIPLSPAKMARNCFKRNILVKNANFQSQPTAPAIGHISRNLAAHNVLAGKTIGPANCFSAYLARTHKLLADQVIYVEFQPVLKTRSFTGSRHIESLAIAAVR